MIFEDKKSCSIAGSIKKKKGVQFNISDDRCNTQSLIAQNNFHRKFNAVQTAATKTRKIKQAYHTQRAYKRTSEDQDINLKLILNNIQQRGSTFCKYGFLSSEKRGQNRKIFGEYFNLRLQQMKGTMTTGEMWTNKQRSNYLKQNKIIVNKLKLIQKIGKYKREQDEILRKKQTEDCVSESIFDTFSQFRTTKTMFSNRQNQQKIQNMSRNLVNIRKDLATLHRGSQKQMINDMLKNLENHNQRMGKLQQKFQLKMIQIL